MEAKDPTLALPDQEGKLVGQRAGVGVCGICAGLGEHDLLSWQLNSRPEPKRTGKTICRST
ncbi:MAG: hypothetical protein JO308_06955 [Verrucomicrobia bacterium]|nr:hypothetical protein [Verrucomicrobiota bacterium]